jgi:DNA-binding transcriptional MerR regulator
MSQASSPPARSEERGFRIGTVAERLGVTTRTIRYYEELGLLGAGAKRSKGAHRLYREFDITHLQEVLRLRDLLGLSLESINALAQAEEARAALRDEWEDNPSDEDRLRIIEAATPLIEKQLQLVCERQKTLAQFARDLKDRLRLIAEIRAELDAEGASSVGSKEPSKSRS